MRFRLIDSAKEAFPVQRMCDALGVSPSGYFAWRGRPACRRQQDDLILLAHVRSAFAQSNGTCGSPRMARELQDQGVAIGRRRTAGLMGENGLKARQKRRFKRTTDSHHGFPVAPNLLGQDFATERPNTKWGADISYVWTREGMAVSGGRHRPVCPACGRLVRQRPAAQTVGSRSPQQGPRHAAARSRFDPPFRPPNARLNIRPNFAGSASKSRCPARAIATTMRWWRPSSRR